MEDGYIVTNDGSIRDLTTYDMNQLKLKQDGLTIIYGMFEKSKEMNEVNVHLQKYMSEGAMKYGIAVEKVITNKDGAGTLRGRLEKIN